MLPFNANGNREGRRSTVWDLKKGRGKCAEEVLKTWIYLLQRFVLVYSCSSHADVACIIEHTVPITEALGMRNFLKVNPIGITIISRFTKLIYFA